MDKIVVSAHDNATAGMTDRKGLFVFTDMTDSDIISVFLPKYGETFIPAEGMDSIVVTLRSARRYSYVNNEKKSVMIYKSDKTRPNDLIDVQVLLAQRHYSSLIELLEGANVPGLYITRYSSNQANTTIRGPSSLGNNEPLVVIDGMQVRDLNAANSRVNVHDIKTIEVQKNGSEWGSRGRNGVIVITTIK